MGKVSTGFSMSLDGFVAGPIDDVQHVFAWMTRGDTEYILTTGDKEMELKIKAASAEMFDDAINTIGASVAGRRGQKGCGSLHDYCAAVPQRWTA